MKSENPSHPGELIERVLMRNWKISAPGLAARTGIDPSELNAIIAGKKPVTQEVASRFNTHYGSVGQSLLRLQARFDGTSPS